jgi:predicted DNA-binding transcriptional regulator AlpA
MLISDENHDETPDEFVPDPQVWREFGVTAMTGHRWTSNPALDFPPKIKIGDRNFRSRRQLEAFKQRMVRQAMKRARRSPDSQLAEV